MFFHDLFLGMWVAFILVAPIMAISLIGAKGKAIEHTLIAGLCTTVVIGIINWLVFWTLVPPVGLTKIAIYHEYWILFGATLISAVVAGTAATGYFGVDGAYQRPAPTVGSWIVAILLIGALVYGIDHQGVFTNHRAKVLAGETHVVFEKAEQYPDTDADHILQVPEETADFKANQVLGNSRVTLHNVRRNLGTLYNLGTGTLQYVGTGLYWIYGLEPSGWRNSKKLPDSEVPGFVVVDAENPHSQPQLRLKDAEGNAYHIKWYLGGFTWHKLQRYLWGHGYRNQVVTGATLEVDDNWKPYYTASLDVPTVGLHRDVPGKALVVNPQTGHISSYRIGKSLHKGEVSKLPGWVDRIYTADVVKKMLGWWGEWGQATYSLNPSSGNRYKVGGDPVLVYTRGGHPVWQVIMTSWGKDSSAAYLALFDARDNEARMYEISGLTLSSAPEHVILGSRQNPKNPPLRPVHMTLHKIYGQLTWVAPLISPNSDGTTRSAQQGIALLPYNETNGDNVVIETSMSAALTQYRVNLANGDDNSDPDENANKKQAEGKVNNLSQVVENGQTVTYFTLGEDIKHVYRATLQPSGSNKQNLELPFIKTGARVRLTYLGDTSARRDVGAYDDLDLQLANK